MMRAACLSLVLLAGAAAPRAQAQDTLRVATLNLWHDQHDWPARRAMIVAEVQQRRVDVLMLQEVLQHASLRNQAEDLAERLGMQVRFASVDTLTRERRYGNAILSRLPFDTTAERKLRPLNQWRIAAFAHVRLNGHPLRLYTTHLHDTPNIEGGGIRAMQLRDLLAFMDDSAGDGAPALLAGDFNAEPAWPELRMLTPFRDVGAAFGETRGTWGEPYNHFPGRRIDYVFDGRDARLVPIQFARAFDQPDAEGRLPSDHYGLFAAFLVR